MFITRAFTAPTPRSNLWLALFVASAPLAGAFFGQYALGWYPCELCWYQRYPYMAMIPPALGGLFIAKTPKAQNRLLLMCMPLLVVNAAIAFYHSGVEFDVFDGPSACAASSSGEKTIEQLRAEIMGAPLVSCKQAMAYVFGLSLAMWNLIITSLSAIMLAYLWRKTKRSAI